MKNNELLANFCNSLNKYNFKLWVSGSVITIHKEFPIGDRRAFANTEMESSICFDYVPVNKCSSSIWGTDGGSIGGAMALQNGMFRMNISGVKKSFLNALLKRAKKS